MTDLAPIYIFDSFAVLALLGEETGAQRVQAILDMAQKGNAQVILSTINLGEILYITERSQGLTKANEVLAAIDQLPMMLLPASKKRVLAAAHIKANYPVAYADAFAIAAALEFKAPAVTNDPEFHAVTDLIKIEWLAGVTK